MKNRSLHFRYLLIVLVIALVCMAILFKMSRTIFVERDKWQAKAEKPLYDTVPVVATRGNILAADGRLLATTMPRYTMYMDFAADGFYRDTFFRYLDPLCRPLARMPGHRSGYASQASLLLRLTQQYSPHYRSRVPPPAFFGFK